MSDQTGPPARCARQNLSAHCRTSYQFGQTPSQLLLEPGNRQLASFYMLMLLPGVAENVREASADMTPVKTLRG